jgi:branched-chain amino acid transport system permease protein
VNALKTLLPRKDVQVGLAAVIALAALILVPALFTGFWVARFSQTAIFTILASSVGLLYGRVGLVSLGQVAPYGIGAWVTLRLAFATSLPFPVLLIVAGLVAAAIGVLIGLPALRVSGLYLALVTLMLAASVEIVLSQLKFPNGGNGFSGLVVSLSDIQPMRRPGYAQSDVAYYRFLVVVAFVVMMAVAYILTRKPGRAWASIRQSEVSALAAGIDTTRYKLYAFAIAAFMAGVAGGLFAGTIPKGLSLDPFTRQAAIFLIAVAVMGGIRSLWGGLLAAVFATLLLAFLTQNAPGHQAWTDFSLSLFGFGLLMNLIQNTKADEKKGIAS